MSSKIGVDLKILHPGLRQVSLAYATPGSAGIDLRAAIDDEHLILPHTTALIPSGIALHINDTALVGLLFARSGLAIKHGITLANAVGVIDSDFQGEIKIALHNISDLAYYVQPMDRIAQLVFVRMTQVNLNEVAEFDQTARGTGGFGHSGKN